MKNVFGSIDRVHARAGLVLVFGAIGVFEGHPAAARPADPGRYEAMVGAPAPQRSGAAGDCEGGIAFGSGDGRCGSLSGGPSGGDNSRN